MSDINFVTTEEDKKKKREPASKDDQGSVEFHTPSKPLTPERKGPGPFALMLQGFAKRIQAAFARAKKPARPANAPLSKRSPRQPQPQSKPVRAPKAAKPKTPEPKPALFTQPQGSEHDENALGINLMPWNDPKVFWVRRVQIIVVGVSVLIVALWGIKLRVDLSSQKGDIAALQQEIDVLDRQLAAFDQDALAEGSRAILVQSEFVDLYTHLPHWSRFITWLEQTTHPRVSYEELSIDRTGTVLLSAFTPEYTFAAEQWLAFERETDWLDTIHLGDFKQKELDAEEGSGSEVVAFSIDLALNMNAIDSVEDEQP